MNETTKVIFADKIVKWGLVFSSGLLLFETIYILIFYFSLQPFIPLFNQLPWGEARISPRIGIFLPAGLALVIFFGNFYFIVRIYEKNPLLARITAITTLLISILSFIFASRTIYLIS